MNIVIFGPPGAGKGTQSKFIVNKYNLFQLSTGELLRNEIRNNTTLGSKISSIIDWENCFRWYCGQPHRKIISNDIYKQRLDGHPRSLACKKFGYTFKKNKQKIDLNKIIGKLRNNKKKNFGKKDTRKKIWW